MTPRLFGLIAGLTCLAILLFLPADLAQGQELHRAMDRPLILWAPLPVIGTDSVTRETVRDELPIIATAEWPEFTDTLIQRLAQCTGLRAPKAWAIRTVAAPAFTVNIWYGGRWVGEQAFIGYTFASVHRIYVAQSGLRSRRLLRHELLHAILADNGLDPRHGTPLANALFPRCAPEAE